jgi:hypothetical protein
MHVYVPLLWVVALITNGIATHQINVEMFANGLLFRKQA